MGAASIGRGRREDTLDTGNQPALRASASPYPSGLGDWSRWPTEST